MQNTLPSVLEDETQPLPPGEWFDDLTWSPSQCYYRLQYNGADYILYLRWRWTDPWQGYVVKNAASLDEMNEGEVVWSGDVFAMHSVYYGDGELEDAKDKLIGLFYQFDGQFTELRQILQQYEENSRQNLGGSSPFLCVVPQIGGLFQRPGLDMRENTPALPDQCLVITP